MPIERKELSYITTESASTLIGADGKAVVLQCAFEGGKTANIAVSTRQANELLHDLASHLSASLGYGTAAGAAGFTRMTLVTKASANSTEADNEVALSLIDEAGVAHYFVMSAEASGALRSSLRSAETKAKNPLRLPRA